MEAKFLDSIIFRQNQQQLVQSNQTIENWAKSNVWLKLEICEAKKEIVEFKAFYQNGLNKYIHHERSVFKKIGQDWYYLRGTYPQ